jgi:hypothetical protein
VDLTGPSQRVCRSHRCRVRRGGRSHDIDLLGRIRRGGLMPGISLVSVDLLGPVSRIAFGPSKWMARSAFS